MKLMVALLVGLAGCSSPKLMVRPLGAVIREAASNAQAAGAMELTLEVAVISAYKVNTSVPVTVVTLGGEISGSHSSKVTVKIPDLTVWESRGPEDATLDPLYYLDRSTWQLIPIPHD